MSQWAPPPHLVLSQKGPEVLLLRWGGICRGWTGCFSPIQPLEEQLPGLSELEGQRSTALNLPGHA